MPSGQPSQWYKGTAGLWANLSGLEETGKQALGKHNGIYIHFRGGPILPLISKFIVVNFGVFSRWSCHLLIDNSTSFSVLMSFISLPFQIALAKNSSTLLKRKDKSRERIISRCTLSMIVVVSFYMQSSLCWETFLLYPICYKIYLEWILNFVKLISVFIETTVWSLFFFVSRL